LLIVIILVLHTSEVVGVFQFQSKKKTLARTVKKGASVNDHTSASCIPTRKPYGLNRILTT